MKKDLKPQIIHTARNLFSEKGYQAVSMRDIADTLEISVGNLTYHFKRKEDLIEAVILDQHKQYKKQNTPQTIGELDALFRHIIRHQREHAYYFKYYTQLADLSPKVYAIQIKLMGDMEDILQGAFQNLHRAGLLCPELIEDEADSLICALMALCINGLPLFLRSRPENTEDAILASLRRILWLALNEKGRQDPVFSRSSVL